MIIKQKHGFTLVELAAVILIIGVLAAIIIVAYNGVQRNATSASLKSDLESGAALAEAKRASTGKYAATGTALGLDPSGTNQLLYTAYNTGYCLEATSGSVTFNFSSKTQKITDGRCEGDVAKPAGNGVYANVNGTGDEVSFIYPIVIADAPDGNLYVGQANGWSGSQMLIRKVTPAGVVTTFFVGEGTFGGYGDFEFGPDGTLYIADYSGRRIRTLSPSGVPGTYAGTGTAGNANGPALNAQFRSPSGIGFDKAGNMFVADGFGNYSIRMISAAGTVSLLAGGSYGDTNGTGGLAQFGDLSDLVVDSQGNIFVIDNEFRKIKKVTQAGVVTTLAGSGTYASVDGTGTAASFMQLRGMAIDNLDNIYVTDSDGHRIRKITPDGVVTTIAGNGSYGTVNGDAFSSRLASPMDVTVDRNGDLYVVDGGGRTVRKFSNP